MPIVSSSILRIINKPNGMAVYEQHIDQFGFIHDHRYRTTLDADIDANLIANAPIVYTSLKDAEIDKVEEDVTNGVDPSTINPIYVNGNRKLRAVFRAVMRTEAEKVLNAIEYLNATPDSTLDSVFNVAKRNRIRARVLVLESIKAGLEEDITLREEL